MFCSTCGREVDPEARFCDNCGAVVNPAEEQSSHYNLEASEPAQPGYGSGTHVPNYLVQAILVTICCCVPFGIVAIVYAAQVNGKVAAGNFAEAQRMSNSAKMWCWIALAVGLVSVVLGLVLGFVLPTVEDF